MQAQIPKLYENHFYVRREGKSRTYGQAGGRHDKYAVANWYVFPARITFTRFGGGICQVTTPS